MFLPATRPRLTREDALARLNAQRIKGGQPLYGAAGAEVAASRLHTRLVRTTSSA